MNRAIKKFLSIYFQVVVMLQKLHNWNEKQKKLNFTNKLYIVMKTVESERTQLFESRVGEQNDKTA